MPGIKCLVLCPTRELAIQIYNSAKSYSKFTKVKAVVIHGGVSDVRQKRDLKQEVDILIATPDEADRMLDMGFIHDIKKIIKAIPLKRQTMLFSATMPDSIKNLCNNILVNPVNITITPQLTPVENIQQKVYFVEREDKKLLLIKLLKDDKIDSALVFMRTKHGANKVQKVLSSAGISAAAIHGNKSQSSRQSALRDFKAKRIKALVATDIVSRGIDIDNLSHVINYELPDTSETYIHRIGRTARAGRSGESITFCSKQELNMFNEIERFCKIKFEVISTNLKSKTK
ncbi:atp-dependent rna helicase rhle-related [Holotrichia oblita]|nr:atp-dependent rna helicase rhle-related [Holotrichia oblita]